MCSCDQLDRRDGAGQTADVSEFLVGAVGSPAEHQTDDAE